MDSPCSQNLQRPSFSTKCAPLAASAAASSVSSVLRHSTASLCAKTTPTSRTAPSLKYAGGTVKMRGSVSFWPATSDSASMCRTPPSTRAQGPLGQCALMPCSTCQWKRTMRSHLARLGNQQRICKQALAGIKNRLVCALCCRRDSSTMKLERNQVGCCACLQDPCAIFIHR